MAASPNAASGGSAQAQDKWGPTDIQAPDGMGPANDAEPNNGAPPPSGQDQKFHRDSSVGDGKADNPAYREKQVKPNKVYVGGLPEHTRQEDLQGCFGKIGNIVNIELKVGYGFVEFDTREAAEESVAKYHEGFFMGNKIRVELSHGGGRTAKYPGDPGACFKCGQMGHWARECPNHVIHTGRRPHTDAPLIDRIQPSRDYPLPPPPRDYPAYRGEEYGPPGRYPPRDPRYDYTPYPQRDFRRPPSPPRDYRDYPPVAVRTGRDYDDYRMRGPPPPPPPSRYERPGYYPPENDVPPPPGYPQRGYGAPRDPYDRYERRPAPPPERYGSYAAPGSRPRTPPGPPPRIREEFDRPPREYPAPVELRGRPATPPRYVDYPPVSPRYRRRSQSPPRPAGVPFDSGYSSASRDGFASASYSGNLSGGPSPPPRSGGSSRDYPMRNGRDSRDSGEPVSYRRS